MKKFFVSALLGVSLLSFGGCSILNYYSYLPSGDTPFRVHPLGMKVYNMSGKDYTEKDWELAFFIIGSAYEAFKKCANVTDPVLDRELRSANIVIISPAPITIYDDGDAFAFTDLGSIFIKSNYLDIDTLEAEWSHDYLFFTDQALFGDPTHQSELFTKCRSSHSL